MTFLSWRLYGFTDFVLEASQTPHSRMTDVATMLTMVRLVNLNPSPVHHAGYSNSLDNIYNKGDG